LPQIEPVSVGGEKTGEAVSRWLQAASLKVEDAGRMIKTLMPFCTKPVLHNDPEASGSICLQTTRSF
jgi:hypothetical protein